MSTTTNTRDRLRRLDAQLTAHQRATEAIRRDLVKLSERADRITFGGLGGLGASGDAGRLGQEKGRQGALSAAVSAADWVEEYIARYRLDRTKTEDRQRALDAVLAARPDYDLLLSDADKVRIVANLLEPGSGLRARAD